MSLCLRGLRGDAPPFWPPLLALRRFSSPSVCPGRSHSRGLALPFTHSGQSVYSPTVRRRSPPAGVWVIWCTVLRRADQVFCRAAGTLRDALQAPAAPQMWGGASQGADWDGDQTLINGASFRENEMH
ncbi:unnamed protein product [Arctogadus glacialis]